MSTRNRKLGLLILVFAGCASSDAPLDELSLRDALSADPAVIASMPFDARRALAVRLHAAYLEEPASPLDSHATTTRARVLASDALRVDRGDDAAIALVPAVGDAQQAASELPPLEGRASTSPTDATEARALRGTAGRVLGSVLATSHAGHLVRVTQWPTAIVADGDTVYVNASYLVAMEAYDQPTAGRTPDDVGTNDPPPNLQPTPYTFCSVAGEHSSRARRIFWILGPLAFVVLRGRAWKRRSKRG